MSSELLGVFQGIQYLLKLLTKTAGERLFADCRANFDRGEPLSFKIKLLCRLRVAKMEAQKQKKKLREKKTISCY